MICSPAEIERKRQEALQRLKKNKQSPLKAASGASIVPNSSRSLHGNQPSCSSPLKAPTALPRSPLVSAKPYDRVGGYQQHKTSLASLDFYGIGKKVEVTLSLISATRFCVKTSTYSAAVVDVLKAVPSRNYDPTTRIWNFHINDYDIVLSKVSNLKTENVAVNPLPKFVINAMKSSINTDELDTSKMDETLLQTLLPFQMDGLSFGVQTGGRCLIADDMGLGKTFQALAIMDYFREDWPLLIVTTASMGNAWEQTIVQYLPSVPVLEIQTRSESIQKPKIVIVSHDNMSRNCDSLIAKKFGCVIIDESHNCKNFKTKITQAAQKLCKAVKRVVLLSGTPALSRPAELYSQLSLLDDKFFGSFFGYAKRYCDLKQTNFGLDSSGKSNLQELEIVLRSKFMIRRRKEDVLGTLPGKTLKVIKLDAGLNDLGEEEKEHLDQLSSQFVNTKRSAEKRAILLTFFNETAKLKIPAVCGHIRKIVETKKKFLVFAHHLVMLDAVEKLLDRMDCQFIRIDGQTNSAQRNSLIEKFQTDERCYCALLSITATNAGITLTAAEVVVFAELHWNPSILSQAEARAHRIGQEKEVSIQYLLAAGTSDDHIWPLLQQKQSILKEMGLTKETFSSAEQTGPKLKSPQKLITNFMVAPSANTNNEDETVFDDGLDDVLCNIDENIFDDGLDDVLCNMDI